MPACHRGSPGSIPGQSLYDFLSTLWHWGRFYLSVLWFSPVSIIPSSSVLIGSFSIDGM